MQPQSELEGLNQESQWCKFPSETWQDQEPTFQMHLKEKTKVLASAASLEEFSVLKLFVLFQSLIDWLRPTHIRESRQFYSVYLFKC